MREKTFELDQLSLQLRKRAERLLPLVKLAQPPLDAAADRSIAFATVEILNAWASFTRAFYISCALNAYTASGNRVVVSVPGLATPKDALVLAMSKLKNWNKPFARRNEPSWHEVKNMIRLINEIGASNEQTVVAALSYPTNAFRCLPTARNFFAHRNSETASKCRALAATLTMPATKRPADLLVQRDYTKPNNLLTEWITEIVIVADMMVQ